MDDNLDILDIVSEVLDYEGYEITCVDNCDGFYNILTDWRPHLVLIDFRLADGNWGEICRELKCNPKTFHIPVIILTAYFAKDKDLSCYGCDAVILKPFDLPVVVGQIQSVLNSYNLEQSD